MYFDWDDDKEDEYVDKGHFAFGEALSVFTVNHVSVPSKNYPHQYKVTGFVEGHLVTVVCEDREDRHGVSYIWISHNWPATPQERKFYVEQTS